MIVGIDSIPVQRTEGYCPWQAGLYSEKFHVDKHFRVNEQKYIEFITKELKPYRVAIAIQL
ncbi:hypothetical protein [Cytobacillus kochii]|uniref:hypothetical protein n=1 Tax=Cytobacillus kochii TaxID=859143 RepID=UPI001CD31B8A|nr:hypothetical protein [Cytobacillus kochii]MCA1026077.1 hypothetical protein [Cytobacillus kochii]MCM3321320.1 hypothetical protein [Cytobacillus kochii]MCM3343846.1 hypothetical protein [Cytobacillus kochii]